MVDISIVVPTLGSRLKELDRLLNSLSKQKVSIEVIIVSQDNYDAVQKIIERYQINYSINHIHNKEKGLSKARNTALSICNGFVVTFSDDDCWYKEGSLDYAYQHFKSNQDSELHGYVFQIYDPIKKTPYKEYPKLKKNQLTFKDVFRVSSIELFFNLQFLRESGILFDENFGLGAKYNSGEENIFINDILKRKGKIAYIPEVIVYHQVPTSSSRLNDGNFIGKGPMLTRMHGELIGYTLLSVLWLKKLKMLNKPIKTLLRTINTSIDYNRKG